MMTKKEKKNNIPKLYQESYLVAHTPKVLRQNNQENFGFIQPH